MKALIPGSIGSDALRDLRGRFPREDFLQLEARAHESRWTRLRRRLARDHGAPRAYRNILERDLAARRWEFQVDGRPLAGSIADVEILLVDWLMDRHGVAQLLPRLPGLRWVHSTVTGVDHIVPALGGRRDVLLSSSLGLHSRRMAEFVVGIIFTFRKRLLDHRALQLAGRWAELPAKDVAGATLGVLGAGGVGRAAASLAKSVGMRTIGLSRRGRPDPAFEAMHPVTGLAEFLRASDVVLIAAPLTPQTHAMLGAAELAMLRDGALLINVTREELVAPDALEAELLKGRIAAALDFDNVYSRRHPYHRLPNVLLTHHSSYGGPSALREIIGRFADNLAAYQQGLPLQGSIDLTVGY